MKAKSAYHCLECDEVFPASPQGTCPLCHHTNIMPLAWYFRSAQERQAWLDKIYNQGKENV